MISKETPTENTQQQQKGGRGGNPEPAARQQGGEAGCLPSGLRTRGLICHCGVQKFLLRGCQVLQLPAGPVGEHHHPHCRPGGGQPVASRSQHDIEGEAHGGIPADQHQKGGAALQPTSAGQKTEAIGAVGGDASRSGQQ